MVSDLSVLTCKLFILFSPPFLLRRGIERAAGWVSGSWPRSTHHISIGEFGSAAGGSMWTANYGVVYVLYGEKLGHLLAYLMLFWKTPGRMKFGSFGGPKFNFGIV